MGVVVDVTSVMLITAWVDVILDVVTVCGGNNPGGGCKIGCSGASTGVPTVEMLKLDAISAAGPNLRP
jgi:hypothetical protein